MPDQMKQKPGGDAKPLPDNFSGSFTGSMRKSNAPKISNAEAGGNATGPGLTHQRGQQGRG